MVSSAQQQKKSLIEDLCVNMATGGFRLASTFVFQTQLILIMQS
jgi:hypothetical protein